MDVTGTLRPLRLLVVAAAAALLVAGCGSESGSGSDDDDATADAGALTHVDGIIALQDDELVLTPADGVGEDLTFELGPAVQVAQVRAVEASGAPARVSYREGEEPLVAAAVAPAPNVGEGIETYEGEVVTIDGDTLVVEGADGKRSFDVSGAEAGVFDVTHLEEHASTGERIKVYFDPEAPDVGLAYEDA